MAISDKRIEQIDSEGMWKKLCDFPQHWRESIAFTREMEWSLDRSRIRNICFSGMGGSAVGADLLRAYSYQSCPVPVFVSRDYDIPGWVNENTLFVSCSYSGNTEETLATFDKAIHQGAQIFAVTSGGRLLVEASRNGFDYIKIPGGFSHRAALGYSFVPLFGLFQYLKFNPEEDDVLDETADLLEEQATLFSHSEDNLALTIALEITESLPIIYSCSELLLPVNKRWQSQLEENSKTLSFGNSLPEMTHNEIVGWEQISHLTGRLSVIILEDKEDDQRVLKSMSIVKEMIEDQTVFIKTIRSSGQSRLSRQFSLVQLGDWVSEYVALLMGIDPTPIARIELLKNRLTGL